MIYGFVCDRGHISKVAYDYSPLIKIYIVNQPLPFDESRQSPKDDRSDPLSWRRSVEPKASGQNPAMTKKIMDLRLSAASPERPRPGCPG